MAFHEELPANDEVIVYVYRMSSMAGAAVSWVVRLDGKEIAVLRQNAYIAVHTTPGAHVIKVGDSPMLLAGVIVDAATRHLGTALLTAGTSYYIRCAGFKFGFVSREEAMKELPGMKYDDGTPLAR
ncbi:MAG: hypothetical protein ACRD1B_09265 [Thermoanaerobaculia bacterium]